MTDNDLKVESKEVRVWVDADGAEHKSEFDAMRWIIRKKLASLLDIGGYDSDPDACADAILDRREDVLRWLTLLAAARKPAK